MKNEEAYKMHREFFNRCKFAIDNGFYFEAILMEYASIESRMEVLLSILNLPCNSYINDNEKKKIQLSHRIKCAKKIRENSIAFTNSKFSSKDFDKLLSWIDKRNGYIHRLYGEEINYKRRMGDAKKLSKDGCELCRKLYNEVKRLRRLKENHPEQFDEWIKCSCTECKLHPNRSNQKK